MLCYSLAVHDMGKFLSLYSLFRKSTTSKIPHMLLGLLPQKLRNLFEIITYKFLSPKYPFEGFRSHYQQASGFTSHHNLLVAHDSRAWRTGGGGTLPLPPPLSQPRRGYGAANCEWRPLREIRGILGPPAVLVQGKM